MDRYDEKERLQPERGAEVERTGDVLGLGGAPVPKMPGDPSASDDAESVSRRRERALEDDGMTSSNREDPYQQSSGATGIDMGSGGDGTDIKPR